MSDEIRFPLSAVLGKLEAKGGKPKPSYRDLWIMTVDGKLPATQIRGRWHVKRADLPEIAALLGLRLREPATQPAKRPRSAAA